MTPPQASLLAAGADRRVAGSDRKGHVHDVGRCENIVSLWSEFAAYRLCVDRGGSDV